VTARRIVVAQIGARMHHAVPRAFHRAGVLERFYTDLAGVPGILRPMAAVLEKVRPDAVARLRARRPPDLPPSLITAFPWWGLRYALRRAGARSGALRLHAEAGREFCRRVARAGLGDAGAVYAFSTAALELLDAARDRGARGIVEQAGVPVRWEQDCLARAGEQHPQWRTTAPDPADVDALARREEEELRRADTVLVGSEFLRDVLAESGLTTRAVVVPYGVDVPGEPPPRTLETGLLRVVTVGFAGLRKGAPMVVRLARALAGVARFRWVGALPVPPAALAQMREHLELAGPVPLPHVSPHYRWADVFLLPSIAEGSATVIYEAMAQGLPVVTTPNAGSVVRHEVEGFVLRPDDFDGLAAALARLAGNREARLEMGRRAFARAREHTVERYGDRLMAAVESAEC
jgi:glycosyltransferase involved in cell wall biosynthesis